MTRVSNLDDLLDQLDGDPSIKDGIRSLLKFGLVFEDSQPEVLRLYGGVITAGCRIDDRSPDVDRFGTVMRAPRGTTLDKGVRPVVWDDAPDEVDFVPESALVPIASPGDAVYPGLDVIETIERGGDKPHHLVIEGENLHALQALRYTHRGKVDVIYIDPPYNTGGDLIYNDKYLAKEDAFRHSKWLSFMDHRLRVARDLLSDTGVIIAAIDDNEQAHLRLLMDEIFGPQNFLAMATWIGSGRNDANYTSGGLDYMLFYGNSKRALDEAGVRWSATKRGYEQVVEAAAEAWRASGGDANVATAALQAWWRRVRPETEKGLMNYREIDSTGRAFRRSDLSKPAPTSRSRYDLLHPVTGKPVKMHANGWRYAPETMREKLADGRILFGDDETTTAYYKRYLDEQDDQAIRPYFEQDRASASRRLVRILGETRFSYPKDDRVLVNWLRSVTQNNPNAIVLDFFGGSGSTMHAVMEMNAADGGSRQCILVTNNEVEEKQRKALVKAGHLPGDEEFERHGIFRHVTYPRIKTVATGIREDGSTYSEGLGENVTFAHMTYTTRQSVRLGRDFNRVAPLLWAKAGGRGPILTVDGAEPPGFLVAENYGVLFDSGAGALADFAVALEEAGLPGGAHVFVITDDDARFANAAQRLTDFNVSRLYEDYLSNFEVRA